MKRVSVFLNPRSGRGTAREPELAALFTRFGCSARFTALRRDLDLRALARSEPAEVPFIAAGGDGTVNSVASAVAGTGRAMGVLALGTLNHFARDFGLPLDPEQGVALIAQGKTLLADAAEVNGHTFVNNSSLGVYPRMVIRRQRMRETGRGKWAALVLASARAYARFRCLEVEMTLPVGKRVCTTPFVFIGNNPYTLAGLHLAQRRGLDAGQLAVYVAPGASRLSVLRMLGEALLGRIREDPVYEEFVLETFSVRARHRKCLRVALDGEVLRLPCPLVYRSLPGALKVLCAPPPSGNGAEA